MGATPRSTKYHDCPLTKRVAPDDTSPAPTSADIVSQQERITRITETQQALEKQHEPNIQVSQLMAPDRTPRQTRKLNDRRGEQVPMQEETTLADDKQEGQEDVYSDDMPMDGLKPRQGRAPGQHGKRQRTKPLL
jgi:hypothetical protein